MVSREEADRRGFKGKKESVLGKKMRKQSVTERSTLALVPVPLLNTEDRKVT